MARKARRERKGKGKKEVSVTTTLPKRRATSTRLNWIHSTFNYVQCRKCVSDTEGLVDPQEFFERLKDTTRSSLFFKDSLGEFVTRKLFSIILKETCIPTRPPSICCTGGGMRALRFSPFYTTPRRVVAYHKSGDLRKTVEVWESAGESRH